jgi:hypothetical protein
MHAGADGFLELRLGIGSGSPDLLEEAGLIGELEIDLVVGVLPPKRLSEKSEPLSVSSPE